MLRGKCGCDSDATVATGGVFTLVLVGVLQRILIKMAGSHHRDVDCISGVVGPCAVKGI